jgi:hypothetical protein
VQNRGNRYTLIGSIMTMSIKVKIPSLVRTMSIHRHEGLNVVEGNTCSYSHPTWKSISRAMMEKMF